MALDNVDGILVGSASLSANDFCEMVALAAQLKNV
jgi:triosephosphate isomerase